MIVVGIVGRERRQGRRSRGRLEREGELVKREMARNEDSAGGGIEAAEAFLGRRITKKHTGDSARSELVGSSGGNIRVTKTTEDMKVGVRGGRMEQNFMRSKVVKSRSGKDIKKVSCNIKSFNPEGVREMRLGRRERTMLVIVRSMCSARPFCWDV